MTWSKLWSKDTFVVLALPALTTMFGLQLLRVLLPSFVWYLGDTVGVSSVTLGVFALGTFGAAFLAAAFQRALGQRRALIVATGGVGLVRLFEQLAIDPTLDLALAMLGTVLFTFFFPIHLAHARAICSDEARRFGRGFLLGLAFDTTIHGAFGTLDPSWQLGWLAFVVVLILVALQWLLLARLVIPEPQETYASFIGDLPLAAIGPFVFLALVVLQNVARAATLTSLSLPLAFGLIVLASAIGLGAALFCIVPERSTMFAVFVATLFVAFLALRPSLVQVTFGLSHIFGNLLMFPLIGLIFAGLGARSERGEFWRSAVANAIGWLLFVLFTLLYYVSYDIRLPFPNVILLPLAVVLVGLAAIYAMRTLPPCPGAPDWTSASSAFVLMIVQLAMLLTWRVPAATSGRGLPVRVMTYNLHNGFNTDARLDLESIAQVIEQAKPDVVGLQEIARGWAIDSSVDMLEWLSQRLQMPYVFGPTADHVWGNAILSRYPIRAWGNVPLPPRDLALKRGFLWARVDVGGDEELFFIATHYHHIEGDTLIRQQQSPEIVRFWNGRQRTILLGDFNATPDAKEIAILRDAGLRDAFAALGTGDGFTWPSDALNQRIDYIWFSPDLTVRDLVMPKSTASDHIGVAVTVEKK